MAILDSQGRLLGKFSILDVGAALVILLVIFGIFFYPGTAGSVAQVGAVRKAVEVDVVVRGLNAVSPKDLIKEGQKANIVVRKQPSGEAVLKSVKFLPRNTLVPQPDGSVKALPDPRPEMAFSNDMILTLGSNAQVAEDRATKERTPVLGGEKVKVGMPLELDGPNYNFTSSVISVRIQE
jgi:Domain of unknown function (DUF4330)